MPMPNTRLTLAKPAGSDQLRSHAGHKIENSSTLHPGLQCEHHLGQLPCINPDPHLGCGRGCVHDAGDVPDRHDRTDIEKKRATHRDRPIWEETPGARDPNPTL